MFSSTCSRLNRQGYLATLSGGLVGAVTGTFVAFFLAATAFGVTGLLGQAPLELQPLALLVLFGTVFGCGVSLGTGGYRGAVATSLILLGLLVLLGIAQAVWHPVEATTLWALRSGLLLLLALLTYTARGLYLLVANMVRPEHGGRSKKSLEPAFRHRKSSLTSELHHRNNGS